MYNAQDNLPSVASQGEAALRQRHLTRAKIANNLYNSAKDVPGALDGFKFTQEKDMERFKREYRFYREMTLPDYGRKNNLLPLQEEVEAP